MIGAILAMALAAAAPGPATAEVTAPGPQGPLAGTAIDAGPGAPVVLIVPGSGPTDRDGNNPLGVTAAPYRLLAEALAARGISSVRIDKRGMFGSKAAVADANAVTVSDYSADVHAWVAAIRARSGVPCVWLIGHSEGGLVVLQSAQSAEGICGVVTLAAAGRPLGDVMRDQFRANPANAPILEPALAAIESLEYGNRVDPADLPPALLSVFAPQVQGFLIDLFAWDPRQLSASSPVPLLIVQGDRDIQIGVSDAEGLKAAAPEARLAVLPGVTHVLKLATAPGFAGSLATYSDPSLPVAPGVVDAVADFVTGKAAP
ncbi:alpha/beta hydrolase [Sphingomonas canadensis]|uniref:Alpha/beta hydrolase n=1 Tax=Sphingomonas canadensis TaxID=1219257 RepID=A0ABW3H5K8_9SPHN|nr:lysophospholipase [Sphingomonas canadensis]MCW3836625.1 lysophospholipase [Sphingomonas canadensis]